MPSVLMKTTKGKEQTAITKKTFKQSTKGTNIIYQITERFSIVLTPEGGRPPKRKRNTLDIEVDKLFEYPSLRKYFGPLSIIDVLRFREQVDSAGNASVRLFSAKNSVRRANAAFLIGSCLVWNGLSAEHVCSLLARAVAGMPSYGTEGEDPFPDLLSVHDCIRASETFGKLGLVDLEDLSADQIAFWEDPDNGDMNWILPGKFLAFAGPDHESLPEFIKYAKDSDIRAVVRLNEHEYDPARLEAAGISHLDLPMVDGSVPTPDQIRQFYAYVHPIIQSDGAVAVHCRAGLGRTGTMIGCYLVRQYNLPVEQVIAWARIMRPGCFLTKQPRFMEAVQYWLRDEEPTPEQRLFMQRTLGEGLADDLNTGPFKKRCDV